MSRGYSFDNADHKVKDLLNRAAFKSHLNGTPCERAVVFPSLTGNDVRIGYELGMYDMGTKFRVVEKGIAGKSQREYEFEFQKMMNRITGHNRSFCDYCDMLTYGNIENCRIGVRSENQSIFDMAYYDTCSTYSTIDKWLPFEVMMLKDGAPVMMTFVADYRKRLDVSKYSWLVRQYRPTMALLDKIEMGHLDKSRFGNMRCLVDMRNMIARLVGYIEGNGIRVDSAHVYNEDNPHATVMVFIDGVRCCGN